MPEIIENDIFKSVVPINENKLSDININDDVNDDVNNIKLKIMKHYPNLDDKHIKILEIIAEKQNITQNEIAVRLNTSKATIYRHIRELKNIEILQRVGTDKKGYWKIRLR